MDTCTPTVFHELDREWEHLMSRRQLDPALAAWQAAEPCLAEFHVDPGPPRRAS